jgi:hypothetical protein
VLTGNAVHADDFPGQIERSHPALAAVAQYIGFEAAGTNRINGFEWVVLAVEMFTLLVGAIALDNFIQLMDFSLVQGNGQAQLVKPATGAGNAGVVGANLVAGRVHRRNAINSQTCGSIRLCFSAHVFLSPLSKCLKLTH